MKKVFLLLCLVVAMAGCGGRPGESQTGDGEQAQQQGVGNTQQTGQTQQADHTESTHAQKESPNAAGSSSLYYHADEGGGFDPMADQVKPNETLESAQEKGKTIITLAAMKIINKTDNIFSISFFDALVNSFNNENDQYYVNLVEYDSGPELADAKRRIAIEVGTGEGPDIMDNQVFRVRPEILDKGVLLDLTPYLEECEITTEKYFPAYASVVSGDKIYGITPTMTVYRMTMDKKVAGSAGAPKDVEALVDRLLEYPERAALVVWKDGEFILQYLLEGSESLWGMVDWESRKCDFSGALFSKILDVAKRYSEDAKKGYESVLQLMAVGAEFPGQKAIEEQDGVVFVDYYMDDGRYPKYSGNTTVMINANTKNPEGAIRFLTYIMCRKGQNYSKGFANHKGFSDDQFKKYLAWSSDEYSDLNLTPELIEEIESIYENGKYMPRQNEEILNIIYEESGSYFAGDRTKEEVIRIIQNRVQLYLNEDS